MFSHLGIMLFNPLIPALESIKGVLCKGGRLVANIIGHSNNSVFKMFSEVSQEFLKKIPQFPGWGDQKLQHRDSLEHLLTQLGFAILDKRRSYSVVFTGSTSNIIDYAKVFFQVQYLLNDENRKQYYHVLLSNLQPLKSDNGELTLEIPFEIIEVELP